MGKFALLALAALTAVPGSARAAPADLAAGADAALSTGALKAHDFKRAAKRLSQKAPDGVSDAARLINLGNAYLGLGRPEAARKAYIRAQRSPEQMLIMVDGSEASSRAVAAKALGRIGAVYAVR